MTLLNPLSRLFKRGNADDEELSPSPHNSDSAYCHPDLDKIYKLETVDPRTIRRIQSTPLPEAAVAESKPTILHSPLAQLELPLGDEFVSTIESFVLDEPLQVLRLATLTEQRLKENGISHLRDLINVDWAKFVFVKGLGQGHIDEVRQSFQQYLQGKSLYATQNIDFEAWIRSLLPEEPRRQTAVLLESYGFKNLISLTPAQQAEVRRLSADSRAQWEKEAVSEFCSPARKTLFLNSAHKVFSALFKPWIRARKGIVYDYELMDRLHQLAEDPSFVVPGIALFNAIFYEKKSLFPHFFVSVAPSIFCVDATVAEQYQQVSHCAKSYFYKHQVHYELNELIGFLEREWAREWGSVDAEFIEKVIRSSPFFSVRKGECGNLIVRMR